MRILIILPLLISSFTGYSQSELTWSDLEDVRITKDLDPDYGVEIEYPTFGSGVKKFDNSEVYIRGYLVPIEIEDGRYALSASPYKSCYFCGKAGQWTVIELNLSSKRRYLGYKLDQVLTFKGTFKLNETDVTKLIYVLDDAELYYGN